MCTMLGNEDIDLLLITYLDIKILREAIYMNVYVNKKIMRVFPLLLDLLSIIDTTSNATIVNCAVILLQDNHYLLLVKLMDYLKSSSSRLKDFLLDDIFEMKPNLFKNYFDCFDIGKYEERQIILTLHNKLENSKIRVFGSFLFVQTYDIIQKDLIMINKLLTASIATNKMMIINGIINLRKEYFVYFNLTIFGDSGIHRRITLLESLDNLILSIK